jgi:hypothetical protein
MRFNSKKTKADEAKKVNKLQEGAKRPFLLS